MITAGHLLYVRPDGEWRHYAPGDRFVRIHGPDHLLGVLQRVAHGTLHLSEVPLAGPEVDSFQALVTTCRERGILAEATDEGADPRWPGTANGARPSVHVDGQNPIAEIVSSLLRPHVQVTRGDVDEATVCRSDALVACAGWLPDSEWRQVDAWCRRHDTPWHTSYVEGTRCYLGPLYLPGRSAGYEDTRNRRLAASGAPDELRALWRYLDQDHGLPAVAWPANSGSAVVAGLLVSDLLMALGGGRAPTLGWQLEVDLATATVTRHPVLPIPNVSAARTDVHPHTEDT
ncbi:MAG: hypothetical protein JO063_11720 [Pseudonocardiales bacterium]|nr:hypothetical protein [Pseudonocardiales bacterium]MBV9028856.1 hypothetical protein [Pseudonocardiales bacterium]MBW0010764.1 hypothetical protein [Pseudonocardiales bacterium]